MDILKVLTVLVAVFGAYGHALELCLKGDFDAQFSYILQNEMLTKEQMSTMSEVCHHMETTLNTRWPGTSTITFGSLVTGLGMKSSDVDCLATVPRLNTTHPDRYVVIETAKILLQQPAVHQQLYINLTSRVPIITFFYVPSQIYCDLSFKGPTGVENSRLIKYYMTLDERVHKVTAFLKFWSQIHQLTVYPMLPSYGVVLMALLYFQEKRMVPSVYYLQRNADARFIYNWNNGFQELPYRNNNTESIYELLRGFFKYYNDFNYDDYIISAYAGRPVAKSLFLDVDTVPEEFALYKKLVNEGSVKSVMFNDVWIQDAFEFNNNLIHGRDPQLSSRVRAHLSRAAALFDQLPKDEVLRAILVKNGTFSIPKTKDVVIDTVSEDINCV